MYKRFLTLGIVVTVIAVLLLPVYTFFHLRPSFIDLIVSNTSGEAVRVANHLEAMLLSEQGASGPEVLAAELAKRQKLVLAEFNLLKIKVLKPSGEIVFSSDASEIGGMDPRVYLNDGEARERSFARLLENGPRGQASDAAVVETYVPLMRLGVFVGALEIYADVSDQKSEFDGLITRFYLTVMPIALGILLAVFLTLLRANRCMMERRRVEETLAGSELRFRELFNNMGSGVAVFKAADESGSDFVFVDVNRAAEAIEKLDRQDIIGQKLCTLFPGVRDFGFPDVLQRVWQCGQPEHYPTAFYKDERIDGWRENYIFKLSSGEVVAIYDDVTERQQTVESLATLGRMQERILSAVGEGIYGVDAEGVTTFMNEAAARMLGWQPEELIGKAHHETLHHSQVDGKPYSQEGCPISATFKDGKVHRGGDQIFWRKDGSSFLAEYTCVPIIEGGLIVGAVSTFNDITERKRREDELTTTLEKLRKGLSGTIQAMALIVETRDPYTAGHQRRSTNLARAIAMEMELPENMIDGIRMAGVIHDLGKISVPAEILSKPGKLNDLEFSLIKVHAEAGYDILKGIEFPWPIARIVLQHHERMDGSGYPRGLGGDEILLEARVLAVADVVEAMASHRPYRPAYSIDEALAEIDRQKGTTLDPDVVDACTRLLRMKGFSFE